MAKRPFCSALKLHIVEDLLDLCGAFASLAKQIGLQREVTLLAHFLCEKSEEAVIPIVDSQQIVAWLVWLKANACNIEVRLVRLTLAKVFEGWLDV